MARYKLGIKGKNGRIIDLDKQVKIETLESLDNFTMQFQNEEELKKYLYSKTLLTIKDVNEEDNIKVMYRYNSKVKKLNVAYNDMKKYLDITQLRYELKGLSSDIEFLEQLANFYDNGSTKFNKQRLNVQDIRIYLSDVRNKDGKATYSKILETALNDLFEKAIIRTKNNDTGEVKLDYRGLRDLAFFIYDYKNKKVKKEEIQQTMEFKENKPNIDEFEQTDMFDILDNDGKWELSSEGDPDFPYNSEEERNYKRYLEELEEKTNYPIEEHDHYKRR